MNNPLVKQYKLEEKEFKEIASIIYSEFGININDGKKSLVEGRLQKVVRAMGLNSYRDYINYVSRDKSGLAISELANSISTNHTFFYRESAHFDFFSKKMLPEIESQPGCAPAEELR